MEAVSKKLNLGSLAEKFEAERITPDLVCKLSVHEMETLGVNSRVDMMSLGIEWTKFGGKAPKKSEGNGVLTFYIPKFVLSNLLHEGFTVKDISMMVAVSENTIYQRVRQFGLSKFDLTNMSDKDLDTEVERVAVDFPYRGENLIKQILFQKGVKVQR